MKCRVRSAAGKSRPAMPVDLAHSCQTEWLAGAASCRPPFGLAPGSALGSRPRVALSSAQVIGQGTSAFAFGQGVADE
jgi:hypothetical protein